MSKVPKYIAIKYMCRILYKRSKECNVEGVEDTRYRFQCINAMYVEDVGDGVCGFYATLYAEYTLYTVAPCPARRGGSL